MRRRQFIGLIALGVPAITMWPHQSHDNGPIGALVDELRRDPDTHPDGDSWFRGVSGLRPLGEMTFTVHWD